MSNEVLLFGHVGGIRGCLPERVQRLAERKDPSAFRAKAECQRLHGAEVSTVPVTVKARELEPGDILADEYVLDAGQWNAWRIRSRAVTILMDHYRGEYISRRSAELEGTYRVEHVTYGPWRARILLRCGAVVRVRRNLPVSVYRGKDSYL